MDESMKERIGRLLGRIPSGCAVLTAGDEKTGTGILASWYQQCAFDPPMISVAVKMGRPIETVLDRTGGFVLNLIGEDLAPMLRHFGHGFKPGDPAFEGLAVRTEAHGVVLADCIGHIGCKIVAKHPAGDHQLYIGEATAGQLTRESRPYVHIRKTGFDY